MEPELVTTEAQLETLDPSYLLTPKEVAAIFRVDPKTVTRWAGKQWIASIRTLGGHRRYKAGEVLRCLREGLDELDISDEL